ncbi:hypothetical protein MRBBS_0454 [Marinobacter sp. BSs20148]|jgi:hypothetical protein|nr:hypothetical protein MRBBS_0454 [Marinobacter sp. BSs20148]
MGRRLNQYQVQARRRLFVLGLWPDSTGDLLAALISKVSELKNIARPTGFEPVTTAFGEHRYFWAQG